MKTIAPIAPVVETPAPTKPFSVKTGVRAGAARCRGK
jgi:hypothetical protein